MRGIPASASASPLLAAALIAAGLLTGCAVSAPDRPGYDRDIGGYPDKTTRRESGYEMTGVISYYGEGFDGRKTASGEIFDKDGFTAAHKTLPFHTRIRVTNLDNGKSVVVEVNDRGPYAHGRILDVSYGAAKALGLIGKGTARARITVL
jgi:rare lipoprotein A